MILFKSHIFKWGKINNTNLLCVLFFSRLVQIAIFFCSVTYVQTNKKTHTTHMYITVMSCMVNSFVLVCACWLSGMTNFFQPFVIWLLSSTVVYFASFVSFVWVIWIQRFGASTKYKIKYEKSSIIIQLIARCTHKWPKS